MYCVFNSVVFWERKLQPRVHNGEGRRVVWCERVVQNQYSENPVGVGLCDGPTHPLAVINFTNNTDVLSLLVTLLTIPRDWRFQDYNTPKKDIDNPGHVYRGMSL